MGHTRQFWTADTPFPDGQIFAGPGSDLIVQSGTVTTGNAGAGLLTYNQASTIAAKYFCNLGALLRTGVLATPNLSQRQFGTAALQPGPSSVAGTSGPLAMSGFPPYTAANNPIRTGGNTGPSGKGIQINWVDVIYSALTVDAALATFGLTTTKFVDNTAPLVANIIALGANGLPVTARALPYRFRITPATPVMITLDGCSIIANLNLTAGSGGTTLLYGLVFGVSFNYN